MQEALDLSFDRLLMMMMMRERGGGARREPGRSVFSSTVSHTWADLASNPRLHDEWPLAMARHGLEGFKIDQEV